MKTVVIGGFDTQETANRARRSILKVVQHLGISCASDHPLQVPDATWQISFSFWRKPKAEDLKKRMRM